MVSRPYSNTVPDWLLVSVELNHRSPEVEDAARLPGKKAKAAAPAAPAE